eukprot:12146384-Alexandrium_andersonii.AAC.1
MGTGVAAASAPSSPVGATPPPAALASWPSACPEPAPSPSVTCAAGMVWPAALCSAQVPRAALAPGA